MFRFVLPVTILAVLVGGAVAIIVSSADAEPSAASPVLVANERGLSSSSLDPCEVEYDCADLDFPRVLMTGDCWSPAQGGEAFCENPPNDCDLTVNIDGGANDNYPLPCEGPGDAIYGWQNTCGIDGKLTVFEPCSLE